MRRADEKRGEEEVRGEERTVRRTERRRGKDGELEEFEEMAENREKCFTMCNFKTKHRNNVFLLSTIYRN